MGRLVWTAKKHVRGSVVEGYGVTVDGQDCLGKLAKR